MDRKFVIALSSLAGSMMLTDAHAIGLGEIRLRSSLNEPLQADIKLVQLNDLTENQIIVNLAPADDFARAHVDRDFLLNSLRFRLDLDDPKNPKVVVTTQQPIREPFLNFLVEVQWPSGRLLREYTLLMDLPAFSENRAVNSVKPAVATAERRPVEPKPVKAPSAPRKVQPASVPVHQAVPAEPAAPTPEKAPATVHEQSSAEGTYGPTQANDTMWRIAQGVRGNGSVQQKILAIQHLNPGAFNHGNVNQLKKGQVLKLPSQEEISSIGRTDAMASMEQQHTAWKTGVYAPAAAVGAQIDATGKAQPAAPVVAKPEGQLTLAAPAAGDSAAKATQGSGEPGVEVTALQNDLTVGMEELNRVQRENQEMTSRAKDLDAQKENAEKLLTLQSNELAVMQAKLAAEQQAKASSDAQAAADSQAKMVADAAAQAKAVADAAAVAAQQPTAPMVETTAPQQAAAATETPAPVVDSAAPSMPAEPAAAGAPAETTADATSTAPAENVAEPPVETSPSMEPAAKEPTPAATNPATQQSVEPSFLETLTSNPVYLGVAAVVLILLGLFRFRKQAERAAADSEDEQDELEALSNKESGQPAFSAESNFDSGDDQDQGSSAWDADTVSTDVAAESEVIEAAETSAKNVQPESGDVLGEADIYISFGNFDKCEALLTSAINAEPMRSDYRLKLLELHKEAGNLSAFDDAYKGLIELDDDVAIATASGLRSGVAGAAAVPFAFGVSSAVAAVDSNEEEFDFDLDMDFDTPAESAETADELQDEIQNEVHGVVESGTVAAEATEFFDFDLDAQLNSASQTSIREAISLPDDVVDEMATEEFSLDFDLDLDEPVLEDSTIAVEAQEPIKAVEFDQYAEEEKATLDSVTTDAGEIDEELGFLSDTDESATKLDLARAYIDMGDKDGARDILAEVLEEGRDEQKKEAQALLDSIG